MVANALTVKEEGDHHGRLLADGNQMIVPNVKLQETSF